MKDFLKDVPKLEDHKKVVFEGEEYYNLGLFERDKTSEEDDLYCIIRCINNGSQRVQYRFAKCLSPIPELTHWEASDFHKWFAENGMEGAWVKSTGWFYEINSIDNTRIWVNNTSCGGSEDSFIYIESVCFIKSADGVVTSCTKPIKS